MKSGGDKKRTPRMRLLSKEELVLWRHATADVKPRVKKSLPGPEGEPPSPPPAASDPVPAENAISALPSASAARQQPKSPLAPALTPLAPLDRRLKRRLSSGRVDVDDVIDLHGMTQAQAHRALESFLWRAAGSGAKIVLIITGKGNPQSADDDGTRERGVLRRYAPQWLRASSLRSIVLSVEEAARPHGGSGALYVRLRRRLPG
jgi:DNA-nicking Smr family endonuclease